MIANQQVFQFVLHLADDSLILGHRLSEWCGHGPTIEQDIALTNLALDLVGQSRLYYQYAAEIEGKGRTEDDLAYLRDVIEFRNHLITELPRGDFAFTVLRQYLWCSFRTEYYQHLLRSSEIKLGELAAKCLKELQYHQRFSITWINRLGLGTKVSHEKMQTALDELWPYTFEFFQPTAAEEKLINASLIPDCRDIRKIWDQSCQSVLREASLVVPQEHWDFQGGKEGMHTEHLGYILAEMQFLQRTYPGLVW